LRTKLGTGTKLVAANLGILLALLLATNLASAAILDLGPGVKRWIAELTGVGQPGDLAYADLPPYPDREHARQIWRDFGASNHVRFTPFLEWRRREFRSETTNVSATGDRVVPPAGRPPADAPIVRFFGGSTIWGSGVDDAHTIPAIFARVHPGLRVFNHGETGYNTRQNLERLVNLQVEGAHTDVAVFYEGFNDVASLCHRNVSLEGHLEERRMRSLLERRSGGLRELLVGRTTELWTRIVGPRGRGWTCDRDESRARAVTRTVLGQWRLAHAVAAASCTRLVVVLHPVAFVGRPNVEYLRGGSQAPKTLEDFASLGRQLGTIYPRWQAAARRPGNAWLKDLSGAYDGSRPLYIDYVHVADEGNALMAGRLGPIVGAELARVRRCR
jgi:hypothetical protein